MTAAFPDVVGEPRAFLAWLLSALALKSTEEVSLNAVGGRDLAYEARRFIWRGIASDKPEAKWLLAPSGALSFGVPDVGPDAYVRAAKLVPDLLALFHVCVVNASGSRAAMLRESHCLAADAALDSLDMQLAWLYSFGVPPALTAMLVGVADPAEVPALPWADAVERWLTGEPDPRSMADAWGSGPALAEVIGEWPALATVHDRFLKRAGVVR